MNGGRASYFAHILFMHAVHDVFASYGEHSFDIEGASAPRVFADRHNYVDFSGGAALTINGGYWEHVAEGHDDAALIIQRMARNFYRARLYWMLDDLSRMALNDLTAKQKNHLVGRWLEETETANRVLTGFGNKIIDGKYPRMYSGPIAGEDALNQDDLDQQLYEEVKAKLNEEFVN